MKTSPREKHNGNINDNENDNEAMWLNTEYYLECQYVNLVKFSKVKQLFLSRSWLGIVDDTLVNSLGCLIDDILIKLTVYREI